MNRYHCIPGYGDDIGAIFHGKPVMREDPHGKFVLFTDLVSTCDELRVAALKQVNLAFTDGKECGELHGLRQGRADGETKLKAYQDQVAKELAESWDDGYDEGVKDAAPGCESPCDACDEEDDVVDAVIAAEGSTTWASDDAPGTGEDKCWLDESTMFQSWVKEFPGSFKADDKDKLTKQLLNELYHDRARLEKVVADSVNLVELVQAHMEEGIEKKQFVLGVLAQYLDTHGNYE